MAIQWPRFLQCPSLRLLVGLTVIVPICTAAAATAGPPKKDPVDLVVREEILVRFLDECGTTAEIKSELLLACRKYLSSMRAFGAGAQERLLDAGQREIDEVTNAELTAFDVEAGQARLNERLRNDPALHEAKARSQMERREVEKEVDAAFTRFLETVRNQTGFSPDRIRALESAALADCFLARSPAERVSSYLFLWDLDFVFVVEEASKAGGVLAKAASIVGEDGVPRLAAVIDRYRVARDDALRVEWCERRARVGRYPGVISIDIDDPRYREIKKAHAERVRRFWPPMAEAHAAITTILEDAGQLEQAEAWTLLWCRTLAPYISKRRAIDDMFDFLLDEKRTTLDESRRASIREMARTFNSNRVRMEKAAIDALAAMRMDGTATVTSSAAHPRVKTHVRRCADIHRLSTATIDSILAAAPEERSCLERLAYVPSSRDRWGPNLGNRILDSAESRIPFDVLWYRAETYADAHPEERAEDDCRSTK